MTGSAAQHASRHRKRALATLVGCGRWIRGLDVTPYDTFREAFSAAHAEAQHIAEGTPEVQAAYPEIFDWDGVTW